MDQDAVTYQWLSEDSSSKKVTYRKMRFDYEAHKMYYEWGEKLPPVEYKKYWRTYNQYYKIVVEDGLSLFYYAREHALREKTGKYSDIR